MKRCWLAILLALLPLVVTNVACAQQQVTLLRPPGISTQRQDYMHQLLSAALAATAAKGEQLTIKEKVIRGDYQERVASLKNHTVDVAYFLASSESEQQVTPIRIPLYKGLMSYRVLLISSAKQEQFEAINSIEQLKALTKGVKNSWITTKVIDHYGFNYIKAKGMNDIYKMLTTGKVDYSSRGVIEMQQDLATISQRFPKLAIENKLLFYFELPMYFHIANDRPQLAQRIHQGLMKIIDNGQFEQLFQSMYSTLPANLNLPDRRTIYLQNPYQSAETRQNMRTFWPYQIKKPAF